MSQLKYFFWQRQVFLSELKCLFIQATYWIHLRKTPQVSLHQWQHTLVVYTYKYGNLDMQMEKVEIIKMWFVIDQFQLSSSITLSNFD